MCFCLQEKGADMRLFHVSEESGIRVFEPRIPLRKDLDQTVGLVWAIDILIGYKVIQHNGDMLFIKHAVETGAFKLVDGHWGGDYRYNVQYDYTGLNDIKPQMIEEATKNARAAAVKFAKDSDSELGKIKRAYQGQFSIEDRDANTPYIKRIRVVTTIDYSLED